MLKKIEDWAVRNFGFETKKSLIIFWIIDFIRECWIIFVLYAIYLAMVFWMFNK